jgi:hypothetical protein
MIRQLRDESGALYVCRTGAIADPSKASEEELGKCCVDKSERPDKS